MNVLIVDDHGPNRRLLQAQLAAADVVVFEASDGVEGLATLQREKIDVIVSDILMPRMDGYRFCYEVRADPRFKTIPFIFYTATYTSETDEKLSLELGADKFLRKPAGVAEMAAAIREAMSSPRRAIERVERPDDLNLMKVYSERLVAKLEDRNLELEAARADLRRANASLEERVKQRTAELEAANRQLESFAFFVSHELRAPLRAIEGFTGMLRENFAAELPEEASRLFRVVERNTTRMGQLIEDLLNFCRLGQQAVHKKPLDLTRVAEAAIAELQREWEPRGVKIALGKLPRCNGDERLLLHVFLNLLGNALKFTRRRQDAKIEIGGREQNGLRVCFVRDNGVGFDMRHAGKLFTAFERLHADQTFEGSGLGLGIVASIVQRHGGRIWAEGEVERGATFYFTLEWLEDAAIAAGETRRAPSVAEV